MLDIVKSHHINYRHQSHSHGVDLNISRMTPAKSIKVKYISFEYVGCIGRNILRTMELKTF